MAATPATKKRKLEAAGSTSKGAIFSGKVPAVSEVHISGYYLIGYLDYVANRGLLLQEYGELLHNKNVLLMFSHELLPQGGRDVLMRGSCISHPDILKTRTTTGTRGTRCRRLLLARLHPRL